MPKFLVPMHRDAFVNYEAVVEADSAKEAFSIAATWPTRNQINWRGPIDVSEYDDTTVELEEIREISDEEAAVVEAQPENMTIITVSAQEHATILAALRYYQANGQDDPANRSDAIHDIATNLDTVISLDAEAIDALCERIN